MSIAPPPDAPPWSLPVQEAPLAFVDLEMTGLDVARDRRLVTLEIVVAVLILIELFFAAAPFI